MEKAIVKDKKAGVGMGVLIIALVAVWAFASGKLGDLIPGVTPEVTPGAPQKTMTPTAATSTQTGTQPASDPTPVPRQLISETPPPDVQTHYLGAGMQYAKFSSPIDVGEGFKQWGVTTQGYPVVCTKPPEQYADWEWMM